MFTIDEFGLSGNKDDIDKKYNFTKDYIERKIEEKLN